MLVHDSNAQKQRGDFSLLVSVRRGVAELLAECRKCGAVTTHGLELAWRLQTVTCPECATSMHLTEGELTTLRGGLIEARVRIDRLIGLQHGHDEVPLSADPPRPPGDT